MCRQGIHILLDKGLGYLHQLPIRFVETHTTIPKSIKHFLFFLVIDKRNLCSLYRGGVQHSSALILRQTTPYIRVNIGSGRRENATGHCHRDIGDRLCQTEIMNLRGRQHYAVHDTLTQSLVHFIGGHGDTDATHGFNPAGPVTCADPHTLALEVIETFNGVSAHKAISLLFPANPVKPFRTLATTFLF